MKYRHNAFFQRKKKSVDDRLLFLLKERVKKE